MTEVMEEIAFERIDTGIAGAEESDTINISIRAIDKIKEIKEQNNLTEEYVLRLGTRSGGCSGMSYAIGFDTERKSDDRIFDVHGLTVAIDSRSLFYFMGVSLDYTEGPEGSGFIFHNPNNYHSCGCNG